MTSNEIATIRACLDVRGNHASERSAIFDNLLALLRRDWAVRVLDAWAYSGVPSPRKRIGGRWGCLDCIGPTPDAARHAAAMAVFPSLSADVRAELGECP